MSLLRPRSRRRVLLVLGDKDYADLTGPELAELEASHDLQVLNVYEVHSATDDPVVLGLLDQHKIAPGVLLVQNPMRRDDYVEMSQAESLLAYEKATAFVQLCQLLGATSVEMKRVTRYEGSGSRKVAVNVSAVAADGSVTYEGSKDETAASLLQLTHRFDGSAPDLVAADELVERLKLNADSSVVGLVDLVRHPANQLRTQTCLLTMNHELSNATEAVGSLGHKVLPQKVWARYESTLRERHEIEVEYSVSFKR